MDLKKESERVPILTFLQKARKIQQREGVFLLWLVNLSHFSGMRSFLSPEIINLVSFFSQFDVISLDHRTMGERNVEQSY